jgi:hypothetical protein
MVAFDFLAVRPDLRPVLHSCACLAGEEVEDSRLLVDWALGGGWSSGENPARQHQLTIGEFRTSPFALTGIQDILAAS